MRRAARVDTNHAEVVSALRACGAAVLSLASMGRGVADLLVLHRGHLMLVEVKDGSRPPSRRKLTPDQEQFRYTWPVTIVRSAAEVPALLGVEIQAA